MATRSRNPAVNPLIPAACTGEPPGKGRICTAPRPAVPMLPPPLPLSARQGTRTIMAPSEGSCPPLIAWVPVAASVLLGALLIGILALLIRRTPAAADPAMPPDVALAANELRETIRADLPAAPVQAEPVPPAPAIPEPAAPSPPPVLPDPLPTRPVAPAPTAPSPVPAQGSGAPAACAADHRYGTRIDFEDDPAVAAEKALKEKKLLFVLHVAGNFEKDCFT